MPVQYLHTPALNNQFNLQLNLQWQQHELCAPILGLFAQPCSRSWIFEMCIALSNFWSVLIFIIQFFLHISALCAGPYCPVEAFFKKNIFSVLFICSHCLQLLDSLSDLMRIFKFSFLTLLPVCFWSVKPKAPNVVITQVGFHALAQSWLLQCTFTTFFNLYNTS